MHLLYTHRRWKSILYLQWWQKISIIRKKYKIVFIFIRLCTYLIISRYKVHQWRWWYQYWSLLSRSDCGHPQRSIQMFEPNLSCETLNFTGFSRLDGGTSPDDMLNVYHFKTILHLLFYLNTIFFDLLIKCRKYLSSNIVLLVLV